MEEIPFAIIGGGVIGTALAWEISSHLGEGKVVLFEKHLSLGREQSGRNSEVIHSGLYQEGLKAILCIEGNRRLQSFCTQYGVPLRKAEKLVVALDKEQDQTLDTLLEKAFRAGVPGLEKITARKVTELEPHVQAHSAILARTTAVIDSQAYLQQLKRLAVSSGTQFRLGNTIASITPDTSGFSLTVRRGKTTYTAFAHTLINAAGLYADEVAKMFNPAAPYTIVPMKGEYAKFFTAIGMSLTRNIYPVPRSFQHEGRTHYDLGVHLTPLTDGKTVRVGPAVTPAKGKNDYALATDRHFFHKSIAPFFPGIKEEDLQLDYAGILAEEASTYDFIIERDKDYPRCLHLVGIESPGLTASLAIARHSWKLLRELT